MSEEMKLLMALCDALGFEVKKHADVKERQETALAAKHHMNHYAHTDRQLLDINGELAIDSNGMYTSYLRTPETSYTVNKKEVANESTTS